MYLTDPLCSADLCPCRHKYLFSLFPLCWPSWNYYFPIRKYDRQWYRAFSANGGDQQSTAKKTQPNLLTTHVHHLCRSKYFDFLQETTTWTQVFCYLRLRCLQLLLLHNFNFELWTKPIFCAVVPGTQVFITSFISSMEDNVWQDFILQSYVICSASSHPDGVSTGGLSVVA